MKVPTKPALWASVKAKARATAKGSPPGEWSARKSVLAQVAYKQGGGEWKNTTSEATKGDA